VRRRFFEGLEQRVEGMIRQHVHFVDQVHLVAAAGWRVLHVIQQFTGVIHFGAGSRIDLDQIDEPPLVDLPARGANAAGVRAHPGLAIQRLRENAGDSCFAHAASAREQERVMHLAAVERIPQRAQDVLLPDHFGEAFGAPFAC